MNFEYSVKLNKRGRRVKIAVLGNGRVVVSAPNGVDSQRICSIIQKNSQWIDRAILKCKKRIASAKIEKEVFDKNEFTAMAKTLVKDRHLLIVAPQKIELGKVSVKKMRSRWGSCSPQGNISINLLLGHLPNRLLEYVAVHEVCHLVHHNHSKYFWALVAEHLPDHRNRRRELRVYGHLLASASRMNKE